MTPLLRYLVHRVLPLAFLALPVIGTSPSLAAPATAPRTAPPSAPVTAQDASDLLGSYQLDDAHLLSPFWNSKTVYGESVLFLQEKDGDQPDGALLFTPGKILRVRNARTGKPYELGRDYQIDAAGRRLIMTKDSRIPFLKKSDLYKQKGEKHAVREKLGDPQTWLLYEESGFQEKQVEVDYERAEEWTGIIPKFAGDVLPRFIGKLQRKEPVHIALTGDSITTGANASSKHFPPHMPPYPALVGLELEKVYGSKVDLFNTAKGGTMANGAVNVIPQILDDKPDLVIIAFGMNDVARHNAATYASDVKKIMEQIHAVSPDTEFLLVASCRANPEWSWSPADQFAGYRDALAGLCGEHVALADVTTLYTQILARKRYHDLAGNGINHPNDFGHRLYAQVILALLAPPASH